ncbi:MAG: glycosyltransferase, partial [Deltaproteobacteria bacterium]|nr:glycosyltransferase [Deltaproteobacteria bacterium]
ARMRIAVLQSLALPPQSRLLALVGRIAPEKGQDILVEAMALLSRHLPEATLLLLDKGYADEAPRRVRLLERIAALGLERRVHLLGFRKDVRALMGAVELGVIPSVASEVNCRVAMEFFSVGTPVLAFPTGALPEVVEPGISGLITADYSAAGLARALESMLARPEELERMGNGALRQARTRFSRERFLRDSLAVFEQARRKK